MSETDQEQMVPQLSVNGQYVRDLSFENIAVQKGLTPSTRPDIQVGINVDAQKRTETAYEVAIKIQATAKTGDDVLFIIELDYAGIFTLANIPPEALRPVLLIECPRILFPFARRIVSDVTRDGGFPPLMLDPIDFAGLYRQQLAQSAQPKQ